MGQGGGRSAAEGGDIYSAIRPNLVGGNLDSSCITMQGGEVSVNPNVTIEELLVEMRSKPKMLSAGLKNQLIRKIGEAVKRLGGTNVNTKSPESIIESIRKQLPDPSRGTTIRGDSKKLHTISRAIANVFNETFTPGDKIKVINMNQSSNELIKDVSTHIYGISCGVNLEFYKVYGTLKVILDRLDATSRVLNNIIDKKVSEARQSADSATSARLTELEDAARMADSNVQDLVNRLRNLIDILAKDEDKITLELEKHKGSYDQQIQMYEMDRGDQTGNNIAKMLSSINNTAVLSNQVAGALDKVNMSLSSYKNYSDVNKMVSDVQNKIARLSPSRDADKIGDMYVGLDQLASFWGQRENIKGGAPCCDNTDCTANTDLKGGHNVVIRGGDIDVDKLDTRDYELDARRKRVEASVDMFAAKLNSDIDNFVKLVDQSSYALGKTTYNTRKLELLLDRMAVLQLLRDRSTYLTLSGYYTDTAADELRNTFKIRLAELVDLLKDFGTSYSVVRTEMHGLVNVVDSIKKNIDFFSDVLKSLLLGVDKTNVQNMVDNIPITIMSVSNATNRLKHALHVSNMRRLIKQSSSDIAYYSQNYSAILGRAIANRRAEILREERLLLGQSVIEKPGCDDDSSNEGDDLQSYADMAEDLYDTSDWKDKGPTFWYSDVYNYIKEIDITGGNETDNAKNKILKENLKNYWGGLDFTEADNAGGIYVGKLKTASTTNWVVTEKGCAAGDHRTRALLFSLGLSDDATSGLTKKIGDKFNTSRRDNLSKMNEEIKNEYRAKHRLYKALESLDLILSTFTKEMTGDVDLLKEIKKYLDDTKSYAKWFTDYTGDMLAQVFESMPCYINQKSDDFTPDGWIPVSQTKGGEVQNITTLVNNGKWYDKDKINISDISNDCFDHTLGTMLGTPEYSNIKITSHYYEDIINKIKKNPESRLCYGKATGVVDLRHSATVRKHIEEFYNNFQAMKNIFHSFIVMYNRLSEKHNKPISVMTPSQIYYVFLSYVKQSALARRKTDEDSDGGLPGIPQRTTYETRLFGLILPAYAGQTDDGDFRLAEEAANAAAVNPSQKFAPDVVSVGVEADAEKKVWSEKTSYASATVGTYARKYGQYYESVYECEDKLWALGMKSIVASILSVVGLFQITVHPVNMGTMRSIRTIIGGAQTQDFSEMETPHISADAIALYYYLPNIVKFYQRLFTKYNDKQEDVDWKRTQEDQEDDDEPEYKTKEEYLKQPRLKLDLPLDMSGSYGRLIQICYNSGDILSDNDMKQVIIECNKLYNINKSQDDTILYTVNGLVRDINRRFNMIDIRDWDRYQKNILSDRFKTKEFASFEDMLKDDGGDISALKDKTGSMPFEGEVQGITDNAVLDNIITPSDALGESGLFNTLTPNIQNTDTAKQYLEKTYDLRYKIDSQLYMYKNLRDFRTMLDNIFEETLVSGGENTDIRTMTYEQWSQNTLQKKIEDVKISVKGLSNNTEKYKLVYDICNAGIDVKDTKNIKNEFSAFMLGETCFTPLWSANSSLKILKVLLEQITYFSGQGFLKQKENEQITKDDEKKLNMGNGLIARLLVGLLTLRRSKGGMSAESFAKSVGITNMRADIAATGSSSISTTLQSFGITLKTNTPLISLSPATDSITIYAILIKCLLNDKPEIFNSVSCDNNVKISGDIESLYGDKLYEAGVNEAGRAGGNDAPRISGLIKILNDAFRAFNQGAILDICIKTANSLVNVIGNGSTVSVSDGSLGISISNILTYISRAIAIARESISMYKDEISTEVYRKLMSEKNPYGIYNLDKLYRAIANNTTIGDVIKIDSEVNLVNEVISNAINSLRRQSLCSNIQHLSVTMASLSNKYELYDTPSTLTNTFLSTLIPMTTASLETANNIPYTSLPLYQQTVLRSPDERAPRKYTDSAFIIDGLNNGCYKELIPQLNYGIRALLMSFFDGAQGKIYHGIMEKVLSTPLSTNINNPSTAYPDMFTTALNSASSNITGTTGTSKSGVQFAIPNDTALLTYSNAILINTIYSKVTERTQAPAFMYMSFADLKNSSLIEAYRLKLPMLKAHFTNLADKAMLNKALLSKVFGNRESKKRAFSKCIPVTRAYGNPLTSTSYTVLRDSNIIKDLGLIDVKIDASVSVSNLTSYLAILSAPMYGNMMVQGFPTTLGNGGRYVEKVSLTAKYDLLGQDGIGRGIISDIDFYETYDSSTKINYFSQIYNNIHNTCKSLADICGDLSKEIIGDNVFMEFPSNKEEGKWCPLSVLVAYQTGTNPTGTGPDPYGCLYSLLNRVGDISFKLQYGARHILYTNSNDVHSQKYLVGPYNCLKAYGTSGKVKIDQSKYDNLIKTMIGLTRFNHSILSESNKVYSINPSNKLTGGAVDSIVKTMSLSEISNPYASVLNISSEAVNSCQIMDNLYKLFASILKSRSYSEYPCDKQTFYRYSTYTSLRGMCDQLLMGSANNDTTILDNILGVETGSNNYLDEIPKKGGFFETIGSYKDILLRLNGTNSKTDNGNTMVGKIMMTDYNDMINTVSTKSYLDSILERIDDARKAEGNDSKVTYAKIRNEILNNPSIIAIINAEDELSNPFYTKSGVNVCSVWPFAQGPQDSWLANSGYSRKNKFVTIDDDGEPWISKAWNIDGIINKTAKWDSGSIRNCGALFSTFNKLLVLLSYVSNAMEDDLKPEEKQRMDTVTATQQLLEDTILSMLKLSITVNYITSNRFSSLDNNSKEVLIEAFNRYRTAFTRHIYGTFTSMSDELKTKLKIGKTYQPTPFSSTDSYNQVDSPQPLLDLIQAIGKLVKKDGEEFTDIKTQGDISPIWKDMANIGIFFGQISKEYCRESSELKLYTYIKNKDIDGLVGDKQKEGLYPKENAYKYNIEESVSYIEEGGMNTPTSGPNVMAANVIQRLFQAVQYFYAANQNGATAQIYKVESILHQDVDRIPSDVNIPTVGIARIISGLIIQWSIVACNVESGVGMDQVPRDPSIKFNKAKLVALINLERALYCMILCIELLRGFSNNSSGASGFKDGVQCGSSTVTGMKRLVSTYVYMFYMHLLFITSDINIFNLSDQQSKINYPKRPGYDLSWFSLETVPRNIPAEYSPDDKNRSDVLTCRYNPYVEDHYAFSTVYDAAKIDSKFPKEIPTMTALLQLTQWMKREIMPKTKWTSFIKLLQKTTVQVREVINTNKDRISIDGASNLVGRPGYALQLTGGVNDQIDEHSHEGIPQPGLFYRGALPPDKWIPAEYFMEQIRPTWFTQWPTRYGGGTVNSATEYYGPGVPANKLPQSERQVAIWNNIKNIKDTENWMCHDKWDEERNISNTAVDAGPAGPHTFLDAKGLTNLLDGKTPSYVAAGTAPAVYTGGAKGSKVYYSNLVKTAATAGATPPNEMDWYDTIPNYNTIPPTLHDNCKTILSNEDDSYELHLLKASGNTTVSCTDLSIDTISTILNDDIDTSDIGTAEDVGKTLERIFIGNMKYVAAASAGADIATIEGDLKMSLAADGDKNFYAGFALRLLFGLQANGIAEWFKQASKPMAAPPGATWTNLATAVPEVIQKYGSDIGATGIPEGSIFESNGNELLNLVCNSFSSALNVGNLIKVDSLADLKKAISTSSGNLTKGVKADNTVTGPGWARTSDLGANNIQNTLMKGTNLITGGFSKFKDYRTTSVTPIYNPYVAAVIRMSKPEYKSKREDNLKKFSEILTNHIRTRISISSVTSLEKDALKKFLEVLKNRFTKEINVTTVTSNVPAGQRPTMYGGDDSINKRTVANERRENIMKIIKNGIKETMTKALSTAETKWAPQIATIKPAVKNTIDKPPETDDDKKGGFGNHNSLFNLPKQEFNPIKSLFKIKGGNLHDCICGTGQSLRTLIYESGKGEYQDSFYITDLQSNMANLSELIQSRSFSETMDITTSSLVTDIRQECLTRSISNVDNKLVQGMIIFNELNVNPINVHSMQRFIPFANIYNYSQSFDNFMFNTFNIPLTNSRNVFKNMDELDLYDILNEKGSNGSIQVNVKKDYDTIVSLTMIKMLANPYINIEASEYGICSDANAAIYGPVCRILRGHGGLGMGTPKFLSDNVLNKALLGSMYVGTKLGETRGSNIRYATDRGDVSGQYSLSGGAEEESKGTDDALAYGIDGYFQDAQVNIPYDLRTGSSDGSPEIMDVISWYSTKNRTVLSSNLRDVFPGSTSKIMNFRQEGYERFNTQLIRNVIFISNLQRVMRMTINKWMTKLYKLVQVSNRAVIAEVTERRPGEELGPGADEDYDVPTWM
jgi:hypothetical protein